MRIFGLMVTRNEGGRYLANVLRHHLRFLDDVFVYDDQSSDTTPQIAQAAGATVMIRGEDIPTFLEHESAFRQAGWDAFEEIMMPGAGDWVLAIDADEYFVAHVNDERRCLEMAARGATDHNSVRLRVDEIFDVQYGHPYRRTDGFWGHISAPRFARWMVGGTFWEKEMGGGSVPTYALDSCVDQTTAPYSILHYGYATDEDRAAKFARYKGKPNNGHNPNHIGSILATPTLEGLAVVL